MRLGLTRVGANATLYGPRPPRPHSASGDNCMRRFALSALCLSFAGVPGLLAAQGFGIYEQGTCAMGRAGTGIAAPCGDGSAIFFNPAGLAGLDIVRGSVELNQRLDLAEAPVPATILPPPAGAPPYVFGQFGIAPGTDFANTHLEASKTTVTAHWGGIIKINDKLSIGGRYLMHAKFDYSGTATFAADATNLIVPATIAVGPLTIPAGTPNGRRTRSGRCAAGTCIIRAPRLPRR